MKPAARRQDGFGKPCPGIRRAPCDKNAVKHGLYTREALEERRQLRALIRESQSLIQKID